MVRSPLDRFMVVPSIFMLSMSIPASAVILPVEASVPAMAISAFVIGAIIF